MIVGIGLNPLAFLNILTEYNREETVISLRSQMISRLKSLFRAKGPLMILW
jgi:hypothetical protein